MTSAGRTLLAMACAAVLACATPPSAQAADLEALRQTALELVNRSRQDQRLQPLELDRVLNEAAQSHAADMLRRGYFAHRSPEGRTVLDRTVALGGSAGRLVAENIAQCDDCPATLTPDHIARLHEGWMNSPDHRANILAAGLEQFGFGIAAEGPHLYAVQVFAGVGTPRQVSDGSPQAIGAEQQLALAVELINRERNEAGASSLQPSAALAKALQEEVSQIDLERFDMRQLGAPLERLPQTEQRKFGKVSLLAGSCGGCGTEPTDADIRWFVSRWLGEPEYRSILLDPARSQFGIAVAGDGQGRKLALSLVAG